MTTTPSVESTSPVNADGRHAGWKKFEDVDKPYFQYIEELEQMGVSTRDLVFQFPVFAGSVNLGRYLFFYELYKQVMNLNGHMADVGTFKGASFLFMAKLIQLFEPYNATQVHGFDWFQGMTPSASDESIQAGKYQADYDTLVRLMKMQQLADVAVLHKMDITSDLEGFLAKNPHLRFKLVFIDCGLEKVLEKALENFWPRLVQGGILVMDHYNCEVSPTESDILEKYVGKNKILQMPFNRQPTAYVIKEV